MRPVNPGGRKTQITDSDYRLRLQTQITASDYSLEHARQRRRKTDSGSGGASLTSATVVSRARSGGGVAEASP